MQPSKPRDGEPAGPLDRFPGRPASDGCSLPRACSLYAAGSRIAEQDELSLPARHLLMQWSGHCPSLAVSAARQQASKGLGFASEPLVLLEPREPNQTWLDARNRPWPPGESSTEIDSRTGTLDRAGGAKPKFRPTRGDGIVSAGQRQYPPPTASSWRILFEIRFPGSSSSGDANMPMVSGSVCQWAAWSKLCFHHLGHKPMEPERTERHGVDFAPPNSGSICQTPRHCRTRSQDTDQAQCSLATLCARLRTLRRPRPL